MGVCITNNDPSHTTRRLRHVAEDLVSVPQTGWHPDNGPRW